MYCEKCCHIIDADRCPFCRSRKIREPEPKDPCFLTEQDYLIAGIVEDLLQQNSIPFLKKSVMGAGLAVKVGPMLDRIRFYVPFDQLDKAGAVVDDCFSDPQEEPEQPVEAP